MRQNFDLKNFHLISDFAKAKKNRIFIKISISITICYQTHSVLITWARLAGLKLFLPKAMLLLLCHLIVSSTGPIPSFSSISKGSDRFPGRKPVLPRAIDLFKLLNQGMHYCRGSDDRNHRNSKILIFLILLSEKRYSLSLYIVELVKKPLSPRKFCRVNLSSITISHARTHLPFTIRNLI